MLEVPRVHVDRRTFMDRRQRTERDPGGIQRLRHDIRQPLSAVLLMVASLRADPNLPPKARESLRRIEHEAAWMAEMLADSEEDADTPRVVDVGAVIEQPVNAACAVSPCRLRFRRMLGVQVVADPVSLRRAVRNVVDNAVRAVGDDGCVNVTVRRTVTDAVVEVADSGPGFGRLPRQHGLGLLTVRRFLDDVGGALAVGSSHLGGALVTLRMPLVVEQPSRDHGESA